MNKREFWSKKSPLPEWHAVVFSHPLFSGDFRLVANQWQDVTLGGQLHKACPMEITPPDIRSDSNSRLTLGFPRQVVGREFKKQIALTMGSRDPIEVVYSVYCGDTTTPELTWALYVAEQGGVQFSGQTVQVVATVDNPMRRAVAPIYDPAIFTGLQAL